jgi:hypothetical protein
MPWLSIAKVVGPILLLIAAYVLGRTDGAAIVRGEQAAVNDALDQERGRREGQLQKVDAGGAMLELERQAEVREIVRYVPQIIDRPVYRNVCVDGDGMRLLDRAAAAANGIDPGAPADSAAARADGTPER